MLNRFIDKLDYSSRFRILKGGKVSLVVSAILVSSSLLLTNANAVSYNISNADLSFTLTQNNNTLETIEDITSSVSIMSGYRTVNYGPPVTFVDTRNTSDITISHDITASQSTFDSSLLIDYLGIDSSVTIENGVTLSNTNIVGDQYYSNTALWMRYLDNSTFNNYGSIIASDNANLWDVNGVYINNGINSASFINHTGANISATSSHTDTYTLTPAIGIHLDSTLNDASIQNMGTITANSTSISSGIAMGWYSDTDGSFNGNDVIDSQIENGTTGTINTSSTRNLNTDANIGANINLYSSGIQLGRVLSNTLGKDSSVKNNGAITTESISNITVNGDITTQEVTAEAKGISIIHLGGSITPNTTAYLENNGEITATSKLNVDFTSDGDSIDNSNYFNVIATGMDAGSAYKAEIINNEMGTITVLGQIDVDEKGTVNAYSLWAESNGIKLYEIDNSRLQNFGVINSTAIFNGSNRSSALAKGIDIDGIIHNNSLIQLAKEVTVKAEAKNTDNQGNAYADSKGLNISDDVTTSGISNIGTLDVEAKASNALSASTYGYGMYFNSSVNNSLILNTTMPEQLSAIIKVNTEATANSYSQTEAYGIYAANGVYDSRIISTGDINITAKATSTSTEIGAYANTKAYGVYASDFGNTNTEYAQIGNIGNIEVTAEANSYDYSNARAYGFEVITDGGGEVLNAGNIKVNANSMVTNENSTNIWAESYGIYVSNYSGENMNIVNGYIDEDNNITAGVIEAYSNNQLDKVAYSIYVDGDSENNNVVNNKTSILRGNIYVNGSMTNDGNIELAHNAMDEDSAYISNFTNESTGKLTIDLKTNGSLENTTYSQLRTETAKFENGSTLNVDVLNSSTNVGLLAGNKLENVITATDNLTVNGTLSVTDNSALLNFNYVTSENWTNGEDGAIHLNIISSQTVEEAVNTISPKITQYVNAVGAAKALDKIIDNIDNNPQMESVITRLNQLPTNESVAKAVESTTPVATNATVGATTQISNGIAGIVSQRQNANISSEGMNSGDGMFSENNLWIKPFGSIGYQNDKDGINGFDLKTYGLGFGADTEYKDNQKVGLAFFYTNGNLDVNNMNQNADLDVFTTLVYGNVPVIDDKTNFLYQAGYSWQNTQTDRGVFTGDTAESKYTSKTASLDLKLMRDVNVTDNLLLQPLVNTTYRHFTNPAYNEIGAGALNLNVDKFKSTDLIVGLGTLAHYKLTDDSKIVGNVDLGYDLHDKNQTITSVYEGASGVKFGTDGIDNGRWSYEVGMGYEMDINKTNNINVSYDYQGQGSDFSNNVVSAKYVLKF